MAKNLPKIGARPTEISPDAWINSDKATTAGNPQNRNKETQNQSELSRLTLDIPRSLHAEIKAQCARRGTKMVAEITELLYTHYSPDTQKYRNS